MGHLDWGNVPGDCHIPDAHRRRRTCDVNVVCLRAGKVALEDLEDLVGFFQERDVAEI